MSSLPNYERANYRMAQRARLAAGFAQQVELTVTPFLDTDFSSCRVADIGCGYGHGLVALARRCRSAVGLEPNAVLASESRQRCREADLNNVEVRDQVAGDLDEDGGFDVVVLDNVLEHIDDQRKALRRIGKALRVGGVAYILVPNKLWPFEAHYGLPFLAYLPLPLANRYLRVTGRGSDYTDASYAPSYRTLRRLLAERGELDGQFTLPADVTLAEGGARWSYKVGFRLLERFPALWAVSKAFLVVATKTAPTP